MLNDEDLLRGVEIKLLDGYTLSVMRSVHNLTWEVTDAVELRDSTGTVVANNRISRTASSEDLHRMFGGIPK